VVSTMTRADRATATPADRDALLADQLDILADALGKVVDQAAAGVAAGLAAQGAFLAGKYQDGER